jgi:RNA polymerase sigma factor (sigma-70 family)
MVSRSRPEIHCIVCDRLIDLRTDLNTDENGLAVHEDCHVRSISAAKSAEDHDEDSRLLTRVGLGDRDAIASLYDRHSNVVYCVAVRVCRDSASAEEILQNIFMQIWLRPETFASAPGRLGGRLALLSRNLALDLMRGRTASDAGKNHSRDVAFNPISHTQVSQLMRKPQALVLLLPDADRQLLEMAFFDGKTPLEIAEETGLPVDTIPSRLRRALTDLRKESSGAAQVSEDTGLEVLDLDTHAEFAARKLHRRDIASQMEGLRGLTHSFVQSPDTILQELVNAAVELCGADSAGISLETEEKSDANYYHWVATAGQYNGFLNAVLPRYPSACGICLERGKPQLFRVRQRFFDIMGIEAPLVTDGILLPWQVEDTRGTIFIMAHGRTAAFDKDDGQMMRVLADFAAMAVRHHRQQHALLQQAKATAAAEMANSLALCLNQPLRTLIDVADLAAAGKSDHNVSTLGRELSADLRRLSALVDESLASAGHSPRGMGAHATKGRPSQTPLLG